MLWLLPMLSLFVSLQHKAGREPLSCSGELLDYYVLKDNRNLGKYAQ
jgi:hypothetical protein